MEFHFNVSNLFGGFIHFHAIDFFDNIHKFDNIPLKTLSYPYAQNPIQSDDQHSAEFESATKQNEREGSKGGSPKGCNRRFPLRLPNILCNVVRI